MFLSNVVKWTENVLESVDQKVAAVTKTDEQQSKEEKKTSSFTADRDEIIITDKDLEFILPKKNELKGNDLAEKRLQDALDYTRKYFNEGDVVSMTMKDPILKEKKQKKHEISKNLQERVPSPIEKTDKEQIEQKNEAKEEEVAPISSQKEENGVEAENIDENISKLSEENKFLKQNLTHLHDEVKELNRINDLLSTKYKDVVRQLQSKEQYSKESQDRLENQVSRLLGDKLKTDTEFAAALEERERAQKQLQKKIDELIQQLKSKDAQVSDLQQEKIRLVNESLQHQRHFDQDSAALKQQIEALQESLALEKERYRTMKAENEKRESNLIDEKATIENDYADLLSQLSMKTEDFNRLENLYKIKDSELKLKEQELQEYKQRAAKAIQLRDKQIEELKNLSKGDNNSNNVTSNTDHDAELLAALDREDLTMELERLRGENQEHLANIDLIKRQAEAETTSSRFKIRNLEKSLEKEKQNLAKAQQTIASLKLNIDEMRHRFDLERKTQIDELRKKNSRTQEFAKSNCKIGTKCE
jgi:hypothetical protein